MWFFLALTVICFTIIVLFRMFMDLRRNELNHVRMVQSDHRNHERYQAVKQLEAPKAQMPDIGRSIESHRLFLLEQAIKREQAKSYPVRYWSRDENPQPSLADLREAERMVRYKSAKLDPRLLTDEMVHRLADIEYRKWIDQQRRKNGWDQS